MIEIDMKEILTIGLADTCNHGDISQQRNYAEAVRRGGHVAVVLPYTDRPEICRQMLDTIDVLLLTGGGDLAAWRFGSEPSDFDSEENRDRDSFELMLIDEACKMRKPIFGICRGMQVINVALEGTLWQDLSFKRKTENTKTLTYVEHQCPERKWEGVHCVRISPFSRLIEIIQSDTIMVNSTHHQAIKKLGKGLDAVALSDDLVIEAFESDELPIAAVQWHNERLVGEPFDRLFAEIIKWTRG